MATLSLESTLEGLWRDLGNRKEKWFNVIDKYGVAYDTAFKRHVKNLPHPYGPSDNAKDVFSMVSKGTMLWIGASGWVGLVLTPLSSAITSLGDYLDQSPKGDTIRLPAIDMTPGTYHGSLKFALRTVFIKYQEYVDECRDKIEKQGAVALSTRDKKKIDNIVKLSPFWYPPKDWDVWNAKELADEFERSFWAIWAKRVKKIANSKSAFNLNRYDYRDVVKRLKALNVDKKTYDLKYVWNPSGIDFNDLMAWGEKYKPTKFGDPLPSAVQKYWLNVAVKDFDAKTGMVSFGKGLGKPVLSKILKFVGA